MRSRKVSVFNHRFNKHIGTGRGPTSVSVLGHEIAEQFGKQVLNMTSRAGPGEPNPAHLFGVKAQNMISGYTRRRPTFFNGVTNFYPLEGITRTIYSRGQDAFTVGIEWRAGDIIRVIR